MTAQRTADLRPRPRAASPETHPDRSSSLATRRWTPLRGSCRLLVAGLLAAAAASLMPAGAGAQTAPSGFVVENAFPGHSFNLPTQVIFLPDGRKLVAEKDGIIWVMTAAGAKLATPFVDLSAVVLSNGDRGLLGVAIDPDFATNRWVYLLYTVDPDSNNVDLDVGAFARLERRQVYSNDPNRLDPATRQFLIGATWATGFPQPCTARHHSIGTLRFAPDKTLLVSAGDAGNVENADSGGQDPASAFGAGRSDPAENIGAFRARTLNSLDGKILRVNKDTGQGLASNPFWNGNPTADASRIWAYGLRNPFRFCLRPGTGSTDPAAGNPGVLYIGDVGWNDTEELNVAVTGGLNFGWPCYEGPNPQISYQAVTTTYYPNPNVLCPAAPSAENPASPTSPILWWDHNDGSNSYPFGWQGNSAIGGVFYTGTSYPVSYRDAYYLADFGNGWIQRVRLQNDNQLSLADPFVDGAGGIVDIEADPISGDLFYVDIYSGAVRRIRYAPGNLPPVVNATLTPSTGYAPLQVTANASGSTDPEGGPLTFHWAFGDGGTSNLASTTHTYLAPGSFTAAITVTDTAGLQSTQTFPVQVDQLPPPGQILLPQDGAFFHQSQPLALQATPVDTNQGAAVYRWDIDRHHNALIDPGIATFFGRSTSFNPVTPDDGDSYHLRIRLTVTQGAMVARDTVAVWPRLNLAPTALRSQEFGTPTDGLVQVIATIHSIGEVGTSVSNYELREGATLLASGSLAPIPDGDSVDVVMTVGPLSTGAHLVRFTVDTGGSQHETDEADNEISRLVPVGGLIAAYGFDEGSGGIAHDASGHGLNGVVQGATWVLAGHFGGALSFDGVNDYVDLGNPTLLRLTGDMTLSAWVKAAGTPVNDGQIISKSDDVAGWQLKTSPDVGNQNFSVALSGQSGAYTGRYSVTERSLGTWYHVAGVFRGATHTLQLYVNGNLDNGTLIGAIPAVQVDSGQPAFIGQRVNGYNFNGLIDEVRVYDRALTEAEIEADMQSAIGDTALTAVPDRPGSGGIGAGFALDAVHPNPFNARTSIRYVLPREAEVRLEVYSVEGERVAVLVDQVQGPGAHEAAFEPGRLARGAYLLRLRAGAFTASQKIFYLR